MKNAAAASLGKRIADGGADVMLLLFQWTVTFTGSE